MCVRPQCIAKRAMGCFSDDMAGYQTGVVFFSDVVRDIRVTIFIGVGRVSIVHSSFAIFAAVLAVR